MFTPQNLRPPTSADVAASAGVSRATVSFVMNDKPNARISDETRQRVLKAAADLGYVPNSAARLLRAGTVEGLVLPSTCCDFGPAFDDVLDMLPAIACDAGFTAALRTQVGQVGLEAARRWALHRPEAVFVEEHQCGPEETEVLRRGGVQALLVYGHRQVAHAPSLVFDQTAYARLAVAHLVARGHRRFAYLAPRSSSLSAAARHREDALTQASRAAGAALETIPVTTDARSLRDWAHAWRYRSPRPSALIAHDDRFAWVAIRALVLAGVRVPEDVAVIGADDHPLAAQAIPAITTVTYDRIALAEGIVASLAAMIQGPERVPPQFPPARIIVRESA